MQNDSKKRKKRAPIICAAVVIAALGFYLAAILFPVFGELIEDSAGLGILLLYGGSILVVVIGVIIALRLRLKEIEGGEEDEASQY